MIDERRDGPEPSAPLHPIGVVARRTGISLHVLRAWERRYGVVAPVRTSGGQRLYSDGDIERLRLLREVTEAGRTISQVAELTDEELSALAAADVVPGVRPQEESGAWYREACLTAAERLDGDAVHATLMRAVVSLRPREFMDQVLLPLLHEVGERWHSGRISPVHEHVVSRAAQRVLFWLLGAYEVGSDAPVMVTTTPAGELHEFGAMAVSAAALEHGWRVLYLGPSLPAAEIIRAARHVRAAHVALSIVNAAEPDDVLTEVQSIADGLPEGTTVLAGGAGAEMLRQKLERIGVHVVTMDELHDVLRGGRHVTQRSS